MDVKDGTKGAGDAKDGTKGAGGVKERDAAVAEIYASYLLAKDEVGARGLVRNPAISRDAIRLLQKNRQVPTILVTGSRGKGSVATMLAAILQTRWRVGLFTGPHVFEFNERIRVDGRMISDADLAANLKMAVDVFADAARHLRRGEYVSPMAYEVVAALAYFEGQGTDVNIFECGKGVRDDDVGNLMHEIAVINRIMEEHVPELGSDVEEIARNKAFIMENGCKACFTARQRNGVMDVLLGVAKSHDVRLCVAEAPPAGLILSLQGRYQRANAALAAACARYLCSDVTDEEIVGALRDINIPGRLEVLSQEPYVLFDACMTRESAAEVRLFLEKSGICDVTLVLGLSDDKDYVGVAMEMAQITSEIILTTAANPHYPCSPAQLGALRQRGLFACRMEGAARAVEAATELGRPVVILSLGTVRGELANMEFVT